MRQFNLVLFPFLVPISRNVIPTPSFSWLLYYNHKSCPIYYLIIARVIKFACCGLILTKSPLQCTGSSLCYSWWHQLAQILGDLCKTFFMKASLKIDINKAAIFGADWDISHRTHYLFFSTTCLFPWCFSSCVQLFPYLYRYVINLPQSSLLENFSEQMWTNHYSDSSVFLWDTKTRDRCGISDHHS